MGTFVIPLTDLDVRKHPVTAMPFRRDVLTIAVVAILALTPVVVAALLVLVAGAVAVPVVRLVVCPLVQ
ncbi:hypothetical protein JZ785_22875 [Alicyclobacillus curvatus]|nr:hypothetical protein JZ785_22875 [Alicyclobacillus curvatus]